MNTMFVVSIRGLSTVADLSTVKYRSRSSRLVHALASLMVRSNTEPICTMVSPSEFSVPFWVCVSGFQESADGNTLK